MNGKQMFWTPSLESSEENQNLDGYAEQPVVAIYLPERDGVENPLVDLDIQGASLRYLSYPVRPNASVEGMQQMLHQEEKEMEAVRAEAKMAMDQAVEHTDYTLYVFDESTDSQLYKALGEQKDVTGALILGHVDESRLEVVKELEEKLGLESVFYSPGQAAVRIERVLHARKR